MKRIVVSLAVSFGCSVVVCRCRDPNPCAVPRTFAGHPGTPALAHRLKHRRSKSGDPFVAEVTEPVVIGSQVILPAGTRVNGTVGGVIHTQRFSIFRGQAAMNLSFRDLEVDSRIFPAKMSILGLMAHPTEIG